MSSDYSRKRRKQIIRIRRTILSILLFIGGLVLGVFIGNGRLKTPFSKSVKDVYTSSSTLQRLNMLNSAEIPDWIDVQLIPIDGVSRDGALLGGFNDIVVHYVGNPATTAQQNHDFYCNPESEVSSHFIIGLDGEIIQCVPLNEMAYASNWRNRDTISIEVCHPDESGKYSTATYKSLVRLVSWLMHAGNLNTDHIIRHYDITGKACPLYYVNNEDAWIQFKKDVANYEE